MHTITTMFSVTVITLLCLMATSWATKYSKAANERGDIDFENEEKPFRMTKVNLLWTKGKKKLTSTKLADLYAELTIQDKYEAHLKKARVSDLDQDGSIEAKALKNYARIVEHFGLDKSVKDDFKVTNEVFPSDEEDIPFEDVKLQSMWRRAQEAGFSEKDLQTLREEFQHQQMKVNEFNMLHQELGENIDIEDNVVDMEQLKLEMSETEAKDNYRKMKLDRRTVRDGYARLETLALSMPVQEPQFSDNRVYKLWAMAKKTNWSEEELSSFKEELKHFEHRLSKHAYYKGQLDLSMDKLKAKLGDNEDMPEKHQKLEEKTQFLDRTVNKLYSHLKTRVDKNLRHYEL